MKLLVLDGNSIANRAFYGIKVLTTKDGRFTNAIYGFMNIFLRLLENEKPDCVAVAFDLKAPTFRHKMYDKYKAQRKGMPEELAQQMPVLKELISLLGYKTVTAEGWEADDILGTLAAICEKNGAECAIATGDRDSLQLVSDNVKVLLAVSASGKTEAAVMDVKAVEEKYGVEPKQLIDVKALMGDASDNIPGVSGVGEKTALSLIQKFKTLDGVYQNIDDAFIKNGVRAKLSADKETAYLSRRLAEIAVNAPIETDLLKYKPEKPQREAAVKLLSGLEMHTTIARLGLDKENGEEAHAEEKAKLETVTPKEFNGEKFEKVYIFKGEKKDTAVLVPANGDNSVYTVNTSDKEFSALICDDKTEKMCFDAKWLYHIAFDNGGEAKNISFDGKIAAYLLNPAASEYTIERLAAEYGTAPQFECAEKQAGEIRPLFEKLLSECESQNMKKLLYDIEMPLCEVLASMEHIGVAVDAEGIRSFGESVYEIMQNELCEIYGAVGYEFNVNSPKQLGEALFVKLGLPTRKKTKSGYSTNAETLESLRKYHPVIEHILQYRVHQKLYSTYVEGLLKVIESDGRIHSTFNQTETRTGRISSGEPNLQNIPVRTKLGAQMRKYFVASKGCVLADADYSQIELRILAAVSGDETMINAFKNGEDIHRSTAAKIYGMPPEMITPRLRSSAKAVNFGIVYGISAFGLAKDIDVSVKEADSFIKAYMQNFSGVKQYMDSTVEFARENGYVETLFGRRRALPEIKNSNFAVRSLGERMARNTPIQGTAADIIKVAMVRVYNRLKKEKMRSKLILQVHDELIVEAPTEEKERAAQILNEEMLAAANLAVPLEADVHCGENWYTAKG